jgi:hypothetical protein
MTISKADLIAAVRDHAVANYEKDGFDFLVECWTDEEIANAIKGAKSKTAAIAAARKAVKLLADARQDARATGGVEMPKERKPRSLDDRVILAPGKAEDVRPTKEGSKRALLVQALQRGTTLEHLQELLGWNRDTVSSAIRTDVGAIGLGVERRSGKYFLIMPDGLNCLPVREAKSSRSDAPLSDCK